MQINLLNLLRKAKLSFGLYTKVEFSSPLRREPVSRLFGLDRGTPVDRHYIETFLASHAPLIRGDILEVADNRYTRRYASPDAAARSVILQHQSGNPAKNILNGDLTHPETLPEAAFDCFICTQTLNFIYDPRKALEGCYRLLRPGGVLLATVAGISQISAYDRDRWGDYWRFTRQSAEKMAGELFGTEQVEISTYGNLPAAKALLDGLAVEDLPDGGVLELHDPEYPVIIGIKAMRG